MTSSALVPSLISQVRVPPAVRSLAVVLLGTLALTALAQISIPLPWTPVPITGQTFGVTFLALAYGRRLGFYTVGLYLLLSALGLPMLASGKSFFPLGPTTGYLIGLGFSAWIIGKLADGGATRSFGRTFFSSLLGDVLVFTCGLIWLSKYVPTDVLLVSGLFPFIPGSLLKTALASGSVHIIHKQLKY